MPTHKSKILEKYGERLELLNMYRNPTRSYKIEKSAAADDLRLTVRPGALFVSDYLALYLPRYQPQLKIELTHARSSIEEPLKLVSRFLPGLNNGAPIDSDVFSKKDRRFAEYLIAKYGG